MYRQSYSCSFSCVSLACHLLSQTWWCRPHSSCAPSRDTLKGSTRHLAARDAGCVRGAFPCLLPAVLLPSLLLLYSPSCVLLAKLRKVVVLLLRVVARLATGRLEERRRVTA